MLRQTLGDVGLLDVSSATRRAARRRLIHSADTRIRHAGSNQREASTRHM